MGNLARPLPTTPGPVSLGAAGSSGVVDIQSTGLPTSGMDWNERWAPDWTYRAPACKPIVVGAGGCPTVDDAALKGWEPGTPLIWQGKSYGIEAQLECSLPLAFATGTDDQQAAFGREAEAALQRGTLPAIAEELYKGTIGRANNAVDGWEQQRWITRADDPVDPVNILGGGEGNPTPLVGAIGLLEEYLALCSNVPRGVIHVPPRLVPALASEYQFLSPPTSGGTRFSPSGHVLVADQGYDGYGPADADAEPNEPPSGVLWLYATGPLTVRYAFGQSISSIEDVAAYFLPDNNTVAIQPALGMATWGCCHAAVAVDSYPYFETGS